MNTLVVLLGCVVCATCSDYGQGYKKEYKSYSKQVYQGPFYGSCGADGFYFNDGGSFVMCSNGNSYVQPCAPGSRNSNANRYHAGDSYNYNDFCDVNLVDYGYTLYHGSNNYGSHGGYGSPHGGYGSSHGGYGSSHGGYGSSYGSYAPAHGGYGSYGSQGRSYGGGNNGGYGHTSGYKADQGYGKKQEYGYEKKYYESSKKDSHGKGYGNSYGPDKSYGEKKSYGYEQSYGSADKGGYGHKGYGDEKKGKGYYKVEYYGNQKH